MVEALAIFVAVVIVATLGYRIYQARRKPPAKSGWWKEEQKYLELPVTCVIPGQNGHPDIEVRHWTDIPEVYTQKDADWSRKIRREREAANEAARQNSLVSRLRRWIIGFSRSND